MPWAILVGLSSREKGNRPRGGRRLDTAGNVSARGRWRRGLSVRADEGCSPRGRVVRHEAAVRVLVEFGGGSCCGVERCNRRPGAAIVLW